MKTPPLSCKMESSQQRIITLTRWIYSQIFKALSQVTDCTKAGNVQGYRGTVLAFPSFLLDFLPYSFYYFSVTFSHFHFTIQIFVHTNQFYFLFCLLSHLKSRKMMKQKNNYLYLKKKLYSIQNFRGGSGAGSLSVRTHPAISQNAEKCPKNALFNSPFSKKFHGGGPPDPPLQGGQGKEIKLENRGVGKEIKLLGTLYTPVYLRIDNVVNGSRKNYKLFLSNELVISKKAENGSCLICE